LAPSPSACRSGHINPPQLYSHTDENLHGGVSKLMAVCARRPFRLVACSSRRSSNLARSFFSCVASFCRLSTTVLRARARWMFWSKNFDPKVVDLLLFTNFVDGMWWILVKDSTRHPSVDVPQQYVYWCL
jgi:hypothetical protein